MLGDALLALGKYFVLTLHLSQNHTHSISHSPVGTLGLPLLPSAEVTRLFTCPLLACFFAASSGNGYLGALCIWDQSRASALRPACLLSDQLGTVPRDCLNNCPVVSSSVYWKMGRQSKQTCREA